MKSDQQSKTYRLQKIDNKKGQFYLVAILVIISVFIAFVVINNSLFTQTKSSIISLDSEMKIEKSKTLDYITNKNLNFTESQIIFSNFSNSYIEKIGNNKDVFFLFGNSSKIKIIGQKNNDDLTYYFDGSEFVEITGAINIDISISSNKTQIKIDDNIYEFEFYSGQNLYYLVNYNYNKEVYIIYG